MMNWPRLQYLMPFAKLAASQTNPYMAGAHSSNKFKTGAIRKNAAAIQ